MKTKLRINDLKYFHVLSMNQNMEYAVYQEIIDRLGFTEHGFANISSDSTTKI